MVDAFGKVTRNMVENLKEDVTEGFIRMDKRFDQIDRRQTELFNHQSSYWSPEQVNELKRSKRAFTIAIGIITTLIGILGAFVVAAVINK